MPTPITRGTLSAKGFGFTNGGAVGLYPFTSNTFTPAGAAGRFGPTLSNCTSAYAGQAFLSGFFAVNTTGYQQWTAPATGSYQIVIAGAKGGDSPASSGFTGGRGAILTLTVSLTAGVVYTMVVGQLGTNNPGTGNYKSGSGGGGSFIWQGTNTAFTTLIAAAGGGGGAAGAAGGTYTSSQSDADAIANDSLRSIVDAGGFTSYGGTGGAGGINSNRPVNSGGAGGGWNGNGNISGGLGSPDITGFGVTTGAALGADSAPYGTFNLNGSFGGGGGAGVAGNASATIAWAGGGGGYSGGAPGHNGGQGDCQWGGGGTSYSSVSYTSQTGGSGNTGNGYITIIKL